MAANDESTKERDPRFKRMSKLLEEIPVKFGGMSEQRKPQKALVVTTKKPEPIIEKDSEVIVEEKGAEEIETEEETKIQTEEETIVVEEKMKTEVVVKEDKNEASSAAVEEIIIEEKEEEEVVEEEKVIVEETKEVKIIDDDSDSEVVNKNSSIQELSSLGDIMNMGPSPTVEDVVFEEIDIFPTPKKMKRRGKTKFSRRKIPKNLHKKLSTEELAHKSKIAVPTDFEQYHMAPKISRSMTSGILGIRSHDDEFQNNFVGYVNNLHEENLHEMRNHNELSHATSATLNRMGDLFETVHEHNPSLLRDVLQTFYDERNISRKMSQPGIRSVYERESLHKASREKSEMVRNLIEEVSSEDPPSNEDRESMHAALRQKDSTILETVQEVRFEAEIEEFVDEEQMLKEIEDLEAQENAAPFAWGQLNEGKKLAIESIIYDGIEKDYRELIEEVQLESGWDSYTCENVIDWILDVAEETIDDTTEDQAILHVETFRDKMDVDGGARDFGIVQRETLRLINKFENSTREFNEEVKADLEEDPNMWLLSQDAQDKLKKPADVAKMLYDLERSITLIDKYIPQCNNILQNEEETRLYFTAVIQELLKRAANRGYLKGVQQNWSRWKGVDLDKFVAQDVEKLVQYMAWVRNNIRASNVTDYNDAQMASMGANDIKESLKHILKEQEQKEKEDMEEN